MRVPLNWDYEYFEDYLDELDTKENKRLVQQKKKSEERDCPKQDSKNKRLGSKSQLSF